MLEVSDAGIFQGVDRSAVASMTGQLRPARLPLGRVVDVDGDLGPADVFPDVAGRVVKELVALAQRFGAGGCRRAAAPGKPSTRRSPNSPHAAGSALAGSDIGCNLGIVGKPSQSGCEADAQRSASLGDLSSRTPAIALWRDHHDHRPPSHPRPGSPVAGLRRTAVREVSVIDVEQLLAVLGDERGADAANRLCEACVTMLGVDAAAISLVLDGTSIGTLGASGPAARTMDELQFTMGEGPCLDSVALCTPVLVRDLAAADHYKWPAYGPAMLAYGIRSVFALPVLVAGHYLGALDLFRSTPGQLNGEQLGDALIVAELAEMAFLDLLAGDLDAATTNPESAAWAELNTLSRAEVGQATGMLVAQLDVDPVVALVRLRAHAFATGLSATDVAHDILAHRIRLEAR